MQLLVDHLLGLGPASRQLSSSPRACQMFSQRLDHNQQKPILRMTTTMIFGRDNVIVFSLAGEVDRLRFPK